MRLAAIILLGASISCLAPSSSPGQSTGKGTYVDSQRAALREKILAEKGSDYLSKGTGNCQLGIDYQDLDVNNVRARLYNTGGLFWKGAGPLYNVPKQTSGNAIFAHGIWIGGMVEGNLHMIASDYGPWELWPGPLDENGNPPEDCSQYDRLYKVSRKDVQNFEATGAVTDDLADWPHELGAPVIDGDNNPKNYNVYGGDRPQILGDQTIWWVMNDKGNEHAWSLTPPIGLEVQVTAFALRRTGVADNTTIYRYRLINKGDNRLENAWFGLWVDADLGDAGDDYVGSDTLLDLGFSWNGDDFDGGSDGYGDFPPAVGFTLLQGPSSAEDGIDNDRDGETDEADEQLGMTRFVYYNGDSTVQGNPSSGKHAYGYLQGLWRDGVPITRGGSGRGFSEVRATHMFPDHPPAFWSEENIDDMGHRNTPADRRMILSSGPMTLELDDIQEITYAIVWSQGKDRYDSLAKLKSDVGLIRALDNCGCYFQVDPDPPVVAVSEFDGEVVLQWSNEPESNNYLDQFDVLDGFLTDSDVEDKTYTFEGYDVLQYESEADLEGKIIATFDVPNGVTKVVDIVDATTQIPASEVTAFGTDSGVKHSIRIDGLDNYRDYYFGVRAYAHNPNSFPRIWRGPVSRITGRPSRVDARNGGTRIADGAFDAEFTQANGRVTHEGQGNGTVSARVVDPSVLTGDTYRVRFYEHDTSDDPEEPRLVTNYDILRSDGSKAFDGTTAVSSFGEAAPQTDEVITVDGLSFSITGPEPAALEISEQGEVAFVQIASNDERLCFGDPAGFGCAVVGGDWVYGSYDASREWIMYHNGGAGPEESIGAFAPHDFEIRVTEEGSYGYHPFSDGAGEIHWVPFEVWDIGINPPFTVNDPSDDVQLIPAILSDGGGTCAFNFGEIAEDPFDLGWPVTDRIYAYYPVGERYADWDAAARTLVESHPDGCPASPTTDPASDLIDFDRGRPLQRLTFMMDPVSPNFRESMIPVGNVIRFFTTKPNLPGDVFTINTSGYAVETSVSEVARDALAQIAIVPNPYKGASDYELTNLSDVARFTNLPERADIRVFDLSGALVRTLNKSGPDTSLEWDLLTDNDLPMGSGMYLVHVDVPEVGSRVIKFGLVKKRIQLDLY